MHAIEKSKAIQLCNSSRVPYRIDQDKSVQTYLEFVELLYQLRDHQQLFFNPQNNDNFCNHMIGKQMSIHHTG